MHGVDLYLYEFIELNFSKNMQLFLYWRGF